MFNSRCFTLINKRPGSHCAFRIRHLMHCGCNKCRMTQLMTPVSVLASVVVGLYNETDFSFRNFSMIFFHFSWLFPLHFGIPWHFQVFQMSGHPVINKVVDDLLVKILSAGARSVFEIVQDGNWNAIHSLMQIPAIQHSRPSSSPGC